MAGVGSGGPEPRLLAEAVVSEIDQLRAENAGLEDCLGVDAEVFNRAIKSRDKAEAEVETLRATVATLTAERDRLKACAEHYAADETWEHNRDYYRINIYDQYGPYDRRNGWCVAREALKESNA